MSLAECFEKAEGLGVLATADSQGKVDVAIYARPHVIDENTVVFIMSDRLSHKNLQSNPRAAYLFVEEVEGYKGKRLYLTMQREQTEADLIQSLRRRAPKGWASGDSKKYAVYFKVDTIRPLVGD